MRTIAHISDLHFGRIEPAVVEGLVAQLNESPPSLIVASGDFTQRARAWQYKEARAFLDRLPQPQLIVPGNHDIPLWNWIARFFLPLRNYKKYLTRDLRPIYEDPELLVIGINTARSFTWSWNGFWKDGRISEEQLLDIRLRACPLGHDVFKIVVTHHPFIPPPGERLHGIVGGAHRALASMEECNVGMCLAGHLHMGYSNDVRTHFEAIKRTIISVQAGTATSTRRRGEPNAYNWITINPEHVTVEVRAWNGKTFEPTTSTHYSRLDEGWVPED